MAGTVDDRDPSVVYDPPPCADCVWRPYNDTHAFNSTLSGTESNNATVTVSFTGTGVAVYGSLPAADDGAGGISSYIVDNDESTHRLFKSPLSSSSRVDRVLLYQSPHLANAAHTLFISNEANGYRLFIDFILYNTTSGTPEPTTSSVTLFPATTSPLSTSASASSSHPRGNHDAATGEVVGAVVAGIVLLLGVAAALFFYMRRKRRASRNVRDANTGADGGLSTQTAMLSTTISPFPPSLPPTAWATDTKRAALSTIEYPLHGPPEGVGETVLFARDLAVEEDAGTAHQTPNRISHSSYFSDPPPSYRTE